MKKLITSALCAVMTLSLTAAAFATEPALISPNPAAQGQEEFQPGYVLRIDGEDTGARACIMVPLRAVAEKLGFTVTWNGDGTILLDDGVIYLDTDPLKENGGVSTEAMAALIRNIK